AYQGAVAGVTVTEVGASRTKPGTLNAAIIGFYQSIAFQELSASTKQQRRNILERLRVEHGDNPLALLEQRHVVRLLGKLKPHARRNWLKTLKSLLQFAVVEGFIRTNPADGLKMKVPQSEGHYSWSEEDIARYESHHAIGTKARLALGL